MKYLSFLLTVSLLFFSCKEKTDVRIHILGDSTTEQQDQNLKIQRGWPQMLSSFFTNHVTVLNHGKSGTSSRTFYEGIWWKNARKTIHPGDYVVIQFGHNDEKHQGFDGPTGTVANASYREYLQKFVDEIKESGAIPIFATPIVRKMSRPGEVVSRRSRHDLAEFVASNINRDVDPTATVSFNYPYNMRQIAAANGCPVIDMTVSTAALVNKFGFETATRRIYNFGDGTHICVEGALLFSELFVDELKNKGILSDYIIENPEIAIQPGFVNFGEVTKGAEYRQEIDLLKLKELHRHVSFRVEAGTGVSVSDREYGEYTNVIDLPVEFDAIYYQRLYVRMIPDTKGTFTSFITIYDGDKKHQIPIQANVNTYIDGQSASVRYSLNGNSKPTTSGPVQALEHTLSGLERTNFDQLGTNGIGAHLDPPVTSRAEWLKITGGNRTEEEIDIVADRYAQFGVRAADQTSFYLEKITLFVGGGVGYRIQTATDPSFGNYTVVGEGKNPELTRFEIPTNQLLKEGEILYLRVYPWGIGRLCLSQISFEGKITK